METAAAAAAPARPDAWVRRTLLVTLLAAGLYAAFAAASDARALRGLLADYPLWRLPAALGLVTLGYALRALRWEAYARRLGARAPPATSMLVFLSGFAMGVTPGKVGEAVKAYYLRAATGASYASGVAAVVAERLSDVAAIAILLALGLAWAPSGGPAIAALAVALLVLTFATLRSRRVVDAFARLVGRWRRLAGLARHALAAHRDVQPLLAPGLLAVSTPLGVAAWALEATAMMLLAEGLGLALPWGAYAFVFAAGSIAGVLSFLPGGLGVTEGGMVALLLLLGVAAAPATALTLAIRLATLWWGVLLGLVAVALLHRAARERPAPPEAIRS